MMFRARLRLAAAGPNGRRRFFWTLALAPLAWGLERLLSRTGAALPAAPVRIPEDVPEGLSVVGDAVVHRTADGRVRAWEARCTHLGCRLDRVSGDVVVCPCHGSRFGADGRVLEGPAARPLDPRRVVRAEGGGWIAHGG